MLLHTHRGVYDSVYVVFVIYYKIFFKYSFIAVATTPLIIKYMQNDVKCHAISLASQLLPCDHVYGHCIDVVPICVSVSTNLVRMRNYFQ